MFEFTSMVIFPDPEHPDLTEASVGRALTWRVAVRGGEPFSWLNYLARDIERITSFKHGDEPEGRSEEFHLHIDFDAEVRSLLTIHDDDTVLHAPAFVEVSGYFRWKTGLCPVVKFRTDRGEEVVSSVLELPDAEGGPVQMSMTLSASSNGPGTVLKHRRAPARPGRTPVG